jgi:hypothetical protein
MLFDKFEARQGAFSAVVAERWMALFFITFDRSMASWIARAHLRRASRLEFANSKNYSWFHSSYTHVLNIVMHCNSVCFIANNLDFF